MFKKLLTIGQEHQIKKYRAEADKITALEADFADKTDGGLIEYHTQLVDEGKRITNDKARPADYRIRVFAFFREWVKRTLGLRAHDVQLMAAMALDDGHVAEAATGEGKSLVSHFATYLNNIQGVQCHVVSVNEYLTQRDADETRMIYTPLGLTVGNIYNQQDKKSKQFAYDCDVVYGTPSEFGFDYLRDNMVTHLDKKVQTRGRQFALIDEVDSVLIDEARTPLIISGPKKINVTMFNKFAELVPTFRENVDYVKQEDKRTVVPTEEGIAKAEKALGVENLYDDKSISEMFPNYLNNALKAEVLFHRDKDYIVEDGEVKIVDTFTGRVMAGRRWSEGLHQAIEAKEHVKIQSENQTIATITLQNYFRLYDKLAGMTGTALTEDAEFRDTYHMGVVAIPPNVPSKRIDEIDRLYRTAEAKYNAIVKRVEECHGNGQPVLVGTISVENSERLSRLLSKRGIKHEVLNAKNHAREAEIIAQAGRIGAVTIATNMAGRGTDINLGGNPRELAKQLLAERYGSTVDAGSAGDDAATIGEEEILTAPVYTDAQINECISDAEAICAEENKRVVAAGGLMVIGSERHDSRRIDNQLRGRSGRQGDPGRSCFYLSLEDDLMRLFGDSRMKTASAMLVKSGWNDEDPIITKTFARGVETAQHNVEGVNHETRKNVLKYDDVINKQRLAIYHERDTILAGESIDDRVAGIIDDTVKSAVNTYCDDTISPTEWEWDKLCSWFTGLTGEDASNYPCLAPRTGVDVGDILTDIRDTVAKLFGERKQKIGSSMMEKLERQTMLRAIDTNWMQHLANMDYLKQGIGLRAYSQRDPLTEYKQDAYGMFGELVNDMYRDYLRALFHVSKATIPSVDRVAAVQVNNISDNGNSSNISATNSSVPRVAQGERRSGIGSPELIITETVCAPVAVDKFGSVSKTSSEGFGDSADEPASNANSGTSRGASSMRSELNEKLSVIPLEANRSISGETVPKNKKGISDGIISADTGIINNEYVDEVEEPHCVGIGGNTIISGKLANKTR